MKQKVINVFKDKGFIVTTCLSLIILFIFFWKPVLHANSTYFGVDGDGLQAYFTSLYHAKYDESFLHFKGMNYPYGENVFFTGCQPAVTGFCRLFGLSNYIVGITNLIMLFSIPLCAVFIYLIFRELTVHYLYAAVCAVAISYLSPQMVRMYAHYSLTYQFAIPAFIYCFIKFYRAPSLRKSILIGVFSFFMATTHLYFFGFFAVMSAFYWITLFLLRQPHFKNVLFCLKHGLIQVVIPFVILQFITVITNPYNDRSESPYGILLYKSSWAGVFFPFGRLYEYIPRNWGFEPGPVNDEGYAYVGAVAVIVAVVLFLKLLRDLLNFQFKKFFIFSDNVVLNILIWSSVVTLLYSFAYPFVFGHEEWVKHIGPLKQMRAIARFSWIFYYVINFAAVYLTYRLFMRIRYKFVGRILFTSVALFYCFDAYQNVRGYNDGLNNRLAAMEDKDNATIDNSWIKKIRLEEYQAIIPLPYFHLGSENFNIEPKGNIRKNTFIVSLKTGLPITAVNLSRTSLSQTFKNLQLVLEPSQPLQMLEDAHDKRAFLLLVEIALLTNNERDVLSRSELLDASREYGIYRLRYEELANLWKMKRDEAVQVYNAAKKYPQGNYLSTDSVMRFLKVDYDTAASRYAFNGSGGFNTPANRYSDLYVGNIPNLIPDSTYSVSFWMRNYAKDINPRVSFSIDCFDSAWQYNGGIYSTIKDYAKRIEGDWMLVEGNVRFKHRNDLLKVTVWSEHLMKKDSLEFDDLLARPLGVDVYQERPGKLYKNNRHFILEVKK